LLARSRYLKREVILKTSRASPSRWRPQVPPCVVNRGTASSGCLPMSVRIAESMDLGRESGVIGTSWEVIETVCTT